MSSFWDDFGATGVGAGSGAATGAMIGSAVPGGTLIGAGVGGVVGGVAGLLGSRSNRNAANTRRQSIDAAMARLQQMSQEQYARRKQDLDATLAFYGPADNYVRSLYGGQPAPAAPMEQLMGRTPGKKV